MQATHTAAPAEAQAVQQLPAARQRPSLVTKFASKYSIDPDKLLPILKATAFKQKDGEVSNEQMAALLIVADQYGLNPFTREIFAFPDKQNGIVPVVSVDGWARIINENVMLDGLGFRYSETMIAPGDKRCPGLKVAGHEWIEAVFYRKDRDKPVVIREYLEEVYRAPFTYKDGNTKDSAWQTHTKRFHRHKTLIQGARIAFGYAGLFDEDEAHRIVEGQVIDSDPLPVQPQRGTAALRAALTKDGSVEVQAGDPKPATEKPAGTAELRDKFIAKFGRCEDSEVLAIARDEANLHQWPEADRQALDEAYTNRLEVLKGA